LIFTVFIKEAASVSFKISRMTLLDREQKFINNSTLYPSFCLHFCMNSFVPV